MTAEQLDAACSHCFQPFRALDPDGRADQYRVSVTRTDSAGPYERTYRFCSLSCLSVATRDGFRRSEPMEAA